MKPNVTTTTTLSPIVRVDDVCVAFGQRQVLSHVSFEVMRGETLCILGRSGNGKTTLLKQMFGAMRPTSGRVWFDDEDITGLDSRDMNRVRARFGVMFQGAALLNSKTVGDNVALPLEHHRRWPRTRVRAAVQCTLERLGIADAIDLLPAEISGGMKKRVGIARAIALDPQIVFYDEPSAGLDPVSTAAVDDLINSLRMDGVTSVVVTHVLESVERIADRVVFLHQGRVRAIDTVARLRQIDDPVIQGFLGAHGPGRRSSEPPLAEQPDGRWEF